MECYFNPIFSTPLWHLKAAAYNKSKIKELYQWAFKYKKQTEGVVISNIGGYQSKTVTDFNIIPHFDIIKKATSFLPPFEFSNWWININHKGNQNVMHTHPGADLSLIWYFTDNNKSLKLYDPNNLGHNRCFLYKAFQQNKENTFHEHGFGFNAEYWWDCKAGDILIFPGDVPHAVMPHEHNSPRVSLALNIKMIVN